MKIFILSSGLLPALLLVLIAFLIKFKKVYWLISGYNTMSEEKKKNVDIEGLAGFIFVFCLMIAGIIAIAALFMFFGKMAFAGVVFALLIPAIIFGLVRAQKYDANSRNSKGKMNTRTKVIIGSVLAFMLIVAAGVGVLLHYSSEPASIALESGVLKISGMYGQEINVSGISNLELKDSVPEILYKSNGSALYTMYKGYFNIEGIGQAKVFFDISKPPFIFFKYKDLTYVLNCKDSEMTKGIYKELQNSTGR